MREASFGARSTTPTAPGAAGRCAPALLRFTPAHRRLVVGLIVAFALLVSLGIHGFSISFWHTVIDGSPAPEVLFGEPRAIRGDDWRSLLPLALAQRAHKPRFPLVNQNVGLGQSALVPFQLPVAHPLVLLRPQTWGFFLGDDTGLAWMWWTQALGVFYAAFLALMILSRGRFALSFLGALVLLCSPFLQFWSLNSAPFIAWACIAFVAACHVLMSPDRRLVLVNGAVLGVAGGAFLQLLYPPYQIILTQLATVLLGATFYERVRAYGAPGDSAVRAACVALAVVLLGIAALALERNAGDAIAAMRESIYPGQRWFRGGGWPFWGVFLHDLGAAWRVERWEPLTNLCEAASFWLLFPVVGVGLTARAYRRPREWDPVAVALFAYCLLLTIYCVTGLPDALSRALFLRSVPTPRTFVGLGVADLFLLVRFLAVDGVEAPGRATIPAAVGLAWAAAVAAIGFAARRSLPELDALWIAGAAAVNGALAFALFRRSAVTPLAALAAGLAASTLWFNPVTRGGTGYLRENALARALLATDAEAGGGTRWAIINTRLYPSLLPALGLNTFSGTFAVPQLALWSRLDPEGKSRRIYNRFAMVALLSGELHHVEFQLNAEDAFSVHLPLDATTLRRFGATHVVFAALTESQAVSAIVPRFPDLVYLRSAGRFHLFRIVNERDPH
jgi:hypothetical protein